MHFIQWQTAAWTPLSWPQRGLGTCGWSISDLLPANEKLALGIYQMWALYHYHLHLQLLNLVCSLWNNSPFHTAGEPTTKALGALRNQWRSTVSSKSHPHWLHYFSASAWTGHPLLDWCGMESSSSPVVIILCGSYLLSRAEKATYMRAELTCGKNSLRVFKWTCCPFLVRDRVRRVTNLNSASLHKTYNLWGLYLKESKD